MEHGKKHPAFAAAPLHKPGIVGQHCARTGLTEMVGRGWSQ